MGTPGENPGPEEEGGAKEPEGSTPVPGMAAEAGRQRPPGVWGGVHREVEEAFTIQRIYHLSREAFSEYPPPLPWTVLVLWLRVLTCLWDLTHLTRLTTAVPCWRPSPHQPCVAPGTPVLTKVFLNELSAASGPGALLPPVGI